MFPTRRSFLMSTLCLGALAVAPAAFADGHATPDQAKAMALKAAGFEKQVGPEKAFAAFTDDPAWHDGELFVYAYDMQGNCVANGGVKALVGKNLSETKDPITGEKIVTAQIAIATSKGEGWHDYHFSNPATKRIEKKTSYIVRIGDYYLGVGVYTGS